MGIGRRFSIHLLAVKIGSPRRTLACSCECRPRQHFRVFLYHCSTPCAIRLDEACALSVRGRSKVMGGQRMRGGSRQRAKYSVPKGGQETLDKAVLPLSIDQGGQHVPAACEYNEKILVNSRHIENTFPQFTGLLLRESGSTPIDAKPGFGCDSLRYWLEIRTSLPCAPLLLFSQPNPDSPIRVSPFSKTNMDTRCTDCGYERFPHQKRCGNCSANFQALDALSRQASEQRELQRQ